MNCRICNSPNIEEVITIPNYPLVSGPIALGGHPEVRTGRVTVGCCRGCGSCILLNPSPEEISYDSTYTSSNMSVSMGAPIDEKMAGFLDYIGATGIGRHSRVLEIGCYDGSLMFQVNKRYGSQVYGCEPCGKIADIGIERYGYDIEKEFFPCPDTYGANTFDAVLFRNVLEHVPYPILFLEGVREVLKEGGYAVLDVPDGEYRILNSIMGSVVPEHPNYFGLGTLRDSLLSSGFANVSLDPYKGSIRAMARKGGDRCTPPQQTAPLSGKIDALRRGARNSLKKHSDIRRIMSGLGDREVCFFGANTCTIELLSSGSICPSEGSYIVDDDPMKWGKELVNFHIPIEPREYALGDDNKIFVVSSYYSQEELCSWLCNNLGKHSQILRLYPEAELLV